MCPLQETIRRKERSVRLHSHIILTLAIKKRSRWFLSEFSLVVKASIVVIRCRILFISDRAISTSTIVLFYVLLLCTLLSLSVVSTMKKALKMGDKFQNASENGT